MNIIEWQVKHGVGDAAVYDLVNVEGLGPATPTVLAEPSPALAGKAEVEVMNRIRLEATKRGMRLWRNNVGAGELSNGRFMRWGLANESKAMNAMTKSGDLIGIKPLLIQPGHVGAIVGQFVSVEVKRPGWSYSGTPHEQAQVNWIHIVTELGGIAQFSTGNLTL